MRHTQEQLADVLNRQRQRGIEDARHKRDYGHNNEDTAYPNAKFPDITRQAAKDAYDAGWNTERDWLKFNK